MSFIDYLFTWLNSTEPIHVLEKCQTCLMLFGYLWTPSQGNLCPSYRIKRIIIIILLLCAKNLLQDSSFRQDLNLCKPKCFRSIQTDM